MLAVAPLIIARLQGMTELSGWTVLDALDMGDRKALPSASVECVGASINAGTRAGMLEPRWQITLTVARSVGAGAVLDATMGGVIGGLLGWMPPADANNRRWEPLKLFSVLPPEYAEAGVSAYVVTFTTASLYRGQE